MFPVNQPTLYLNHWPHRNFTMPPILKILIWRRKCFYLLRFDSGEMHRWSTINVVKKIPKKVFRPIGPICFWPFYWKHQYFWRNFYLISNYLSDGLTVILYSHVLGWLHEKHKYSKNLGRFLCSRSHHSTVWSLYSTRTSRWTGNKNVDSRTGVFLSGAAKRDSKVELWLLCFSVQWAQWRSCAAKKAAPTCVVHAINISNYGLRSPFLLTDRRFVTHRCHCARWPPRFQNTGINVEISSLVYAVDEIELLLVSREPFPVSLLPLQFMVTQIIQSV